MCRNIYMSIKGQAKDPERGPFEYSQGKLRPLSESNSNINKQYKKLDNKYLEEIENDKSLNDFWKSPIESTNTILRSMEKKNSKERKQNFINKKFYQYYMYGLKPFEHEIKYMVTLDKDLLEERTQIIDYNTIIEYIKPDQDLINLLNRFKYLVEKVNNSNTDSNELDLINIPLKDENNDENISDKNIDDYIPKYGIKKPVSENVNKLVTKEDKIVEGEIVDMVTYIPKYGIKKQKPLVNYNEINSDKEILLYWLRSNINTNVINEQTNDIYFDYYDKFMLEKYNDDKIGNEVRNLYEKIQPKAREKMKNKLKSFTLLTNYIKPNLSDLMLIKVLFKMTREIEMSKLSKGETKFNYQKIGFYYDENLIYENIDKETIEIINELRQYHYLIRTVKIY